MKYLNLTLAAALMAGSAFVSHAQERAAGSSLETQMTWSALSSKVDATNTKITGLETKLDSKMAQIAACGAASKLYDGKGCVPINLGELNAVINCGNSGKIYSSIKKTCVFAEKEPVNDIAVTRLAADTSFSYTAKKSVPATASANYVLPAGTNFIISNIECVTYGSNSKTMARLVFNGVSGYPDNHLCHLQGVSSSNTHRSIETSNITVPKGATSFKIIYEIYNFDDKASINATFTYMGKKDTK